MVVSQVEHKTSLHPILSAHNKKGKILLVPRSVLSEQVSAKMFAFALFAIDRY
jgi:hypothetical protein